MNPVLRRRLTPHGPDVDRPKVSDAGRQWWDRNRAGLRSSWRDSHAWVELPHDDRLLIHERMKEGFRHPDAGTRERMQTMMEAVVMADLIDGERTASDHLHAEVAAAHWKGRRTGSPEPLEPGEPVPGCTCEDCTGIEPAPVRNVRSSGHADDLPPLPVDAARAVPIMDVAAMLGIEHRRGWATCPFHADGSPSLHLNPAKNAAFCNPCAKSWDSIALWMDYRNVEFVDAVKELAG